MNEFDVEKIIERLRQVSLSSNEKREIKTLVFEYVNKKKISEGPVVSPLAGIFIAFRSHALAFAVMVLVIFAGTGMSFAAEDSLPGDTLYGVKIYINENLRSVVSFNPEQKANWNTRRAERRLKEAQQLAIAGQLTEDVEDDLEKRFAEHTFDAYEAIVDLEEGQNLDIALGAISGLESLISAHQEILSTQLNTNATNARTQKEFAQLRRLDNGTSSDAISATGLALTENASTSEALSAVADNLEQLSETLESRLLTSIQNNLSSISENREGVEFRLNQMNDEWLKNTALRTQRKAETTQTVLKKLFSKSTPVLDAQMTASFEINLREVENLIVIGNSFMNSRDYSRAITTFNEAFRLANRTKILIGSYAEVADIQKQKEIIDSKEVDKVLGTSTPTGEEEEDLTAEGENEGIENENATSTRPETGTDSTSADVSTESVLDMGGSGLINIRI